MIDFFGMNNVKQVKLPMPTIHDSDFESSYTDTLNSSSMYSSMKLQEKARFTLDTDLDEDAKLMFKDPNARLPRNYKYVGNVNQGPRQIGGNTKRPVGDFLQRSVVGKASDYKTM